MTPTESTDNNAMSGLAILFAAIDYHQSKLPASFSIPSNPSASPTVNSFLSTMDHSITTMAARAAAMVGSAPEQSTEADLKWVDSVRKRKMNKKTKKRSKKNKKNKYSTKMAVSIPLPDAAASNTIGAVVSPAASFESCPAALDDRLSFDDGSVETYPKKRMRCEAAFQATPDEPSAKYRRRVSIDLDGLAARMEQQQERLFYVSQQTKRSRAMLHMMRYDLMRVAEC